MEPVNSFINSEERITDFRRWREVNETGINIDYCRIRCRACNDCRNADQTEKVSLRQDEENDMIKNSVTLDYQKQEVGGGGVPLPKHGLNNFFV